MAIFAANPVPVAIMGVALGIGKLVGTVWLKQNWKIAPLPIKIYLVVAIFILMIITSLGCFGLLSKAHLDQNLVGGEVTAKIAIYDEKIRTAKENIDANRKALKQMDEAVDQSMARSTSETSADKAVAIRKAQTKERARLQADIASEQKTISSLNEERAPVAAEVRKVEAEVGPIKYIAAFFYGATDTTVLEKAVTWVIIILIVVFDPLAVMLLLASQISFQHFRKREAEYVAPVVVEEPAPIKEPIVVEEPAVEETVEEVAEELVITYNELSLDDIHKLEQDMPLFPPMDTSVDEPAIEVPQVYLNTGKSFYVKPDGLASVGPIVADIVEAVVEPVVEETVIVESKPSVILDPETTTTPPQPLMRKEESRMSRMKVFPRVVDAPVVEEPEAETEPFGLENYVQNEEQGESNLWTAMSHEEFIASSQEDRDDHIADIVAKVKARTMQMTDVPELLQNDVRARV